MSTLSVLSSPSSNRSVTLYLEVRHARDRFHGAVDPKIYKDAFIKIAEFFSQKELASLPSVSKAYHCYTAAKRASIRKLDLSRSWVGAKLPVGAFETALAQHPAVEDLKLDNYREFNHDSVETLNLAFEGRKVVRLSMQGCDDYGGWPIRSPSWLCRLIHGLDLSAAQWLDFRRVSEFVCIGFLPLLIHSMNGLISIKSIELDKVVFSKFSNGGPEGISHDDFRKQTAKSYLLSLRPDIENLSLPEDLDDELIDLIVSRFSPATIKSCNLTTRAGLDKNLELLRFLPLSEMTHIQLHGFAEEPTLLQYIASKLALNTKLHTLDFGNSLVLGGELGPYVLIDCLHSEYLVELGLRSFGYYYEPALEMMNKLFVKKIPSWPNIEKITVCQYSLPDIRALHHRLQQFTPQELQTYIPQLPLTTQQHVALRADFTLENFADIAQKLAQNEQLETLFLAGFSEQITVPMLSELIRSLHAPALTELYLFPNNEIDFAVLKPALQKALAGNMGMKQLQIGTRVNRLAELYQAPQAAQAKAFDE